MEDEREEDREEHPHPHPHPALAGGPPPGAGGADNVLGMCNVPGCTGDALRDGICKKHLLRLAAKGDPDAAEAVRQWHAVHDIQPETPRVPSWRQYPEEENGSREPVASSREKQKEPDAGLPPHRLRATGYRLPKETGYPPRRTTTTKETTMKKTDKVRCGKCGREYLANGISRHFANCNGPVPAGKPKRKYTRRAKAPVNQTAGAQVRINLPAPAAIHNPPSATDTIDGAQAAAAATYPSSTLAMMGHGFIRLAELLGLAEILADYPHPDGLVLVNTRNGKQALVTTAGEIEAVELTRRANA